MASCASIAHTGWADVAPRKGWNHVVVTYDGQMLAGYFNGVEKARSNPTQKPNTCATSDGSYSLKIGAGSSNSQPFTGQLDEVAVWGRALSTAQVAALWNSGNGRSLVEPLAAKLLLYVDFESGPSRTVKDTTGNGRTGAVLDASAAKWPASALAGGRFAKSFAGRKEDVVVVANRAGMPTGNGARTVSYWFKDFRGNSAAFGLGCARTGQGWNMFMRSDGKRLHLDFYGQDCEWGRTVGDCNDWADVAPRKGWNHVVVTYNGETLVGYFNGVEKARSNPTKKPNTCATSDGSYSLNIGAGAWKKDGSSQPFTGQLDEVAVWGRALSTAQVAALWNGGQGLKPSLQKGMCITTPSTALPWCGPTSPAAVGKVQGAWGVEGAG